MRFAAVAVLLIALAASAPGAAAEEGIKTTKGVTEADYPEQMFTEYEVPVEVAGEDIVMRGYVTRPDETVYDDLYSQGHPQSKAGRGVPTILVLSPYNSLNDPIDGVNPPPPGSVEEYFTQRGYAYAQFDVVGTRESGGCYDYGGIRERKTAVGVINFLGEQGWSNGNVGMIGGSYDGTTQIAAAIEQPEALKAIIPQVAIDRWYDYAYGGGMRYFLNSENPTDEGFDTPFAFDFGFALIPPTSDDATRNATVMTERIEPCDRLTHTERGYEPDPVYDEFWQQRDYRRSASKVKAAVFLEGGWLDHNVKHWDTTRFYEALPDDHPKKMAIGQWNHSASEFEEAQDLRHAFFDRWLLRIDTGIMDLPAVDTQTNTGTRYQHADWPPPGTKNIRVPFSLKATTRDLGLQDGDEASYVGDQTMTEEMALEGQCNGRCLVFATEPLAETIRVSGAPLVHLAATSDKPSTHYTPVLFEQTPAGDRTIITRGFLNAFNRNGLDTSEPLEPGKRYEAPVDVWDTDYEIAAGNRLGVAVLSSNTVWALPDDDTVAQGGPATNTLTLGGASYLRLPLSRGAELFPTDGRGPGRGPVEPPRNGDPDVAPDDGDGSGDVGDTGGETLPATGAGAALPGLLVLGVAVRLAAYRRRP